MHGYNFTERVRYTLGKAREHAFAMDHEYVDTEHILLGLFESGGVGATALQFMDVDLARAADLVKSAVKSGPPEPTRGPDLPYTSRSKRVLELAMKEARDMNHSYVGTEHLLLGLIGEGQGLAAQVLDSLGVQLEKAREQVLAIISAEPAVVSSPANPAQRRVREVVAPPPDELPVAIDLTLRYGNGAVVRRSFTNRRDTTQFLDSI